MIVEIPNVNGEVFWPICRLLNENIGDRSWMQAALPAQSDGSAAKPDEEIADLPAGPLLPSCA